jgi:type II secretory pathway pseudopilin PulG
MPNKSTSRGFTLVEAMVTLGLLLVVFGAISELLAGTFNVMRAQSYKNQATQAMQLALTRMCCEVRECCNVTSPTNGNSGGTLTLQIVDPNYPSAAPPQNLNPYDTHNIFLVTYSFQSATGVLQRSIVSAAGGATTTQDLVEGVTGFTCAYNTTYAATVNISLSVNDFANGIKTISSQAFPIAVVP